jgi:hypothetical protein
LECTAELSCVDSEAQACVDAGVDDGILHGEREKSGEERRI